MAKTQFYSKLSKYQLTYDLLVKLKFNNVKLLKKVYERQLFANCKC